MILFQIIIMMLLVVVIVPSSSTTTTAVVAFALVLPPQPNRPILQCHSNLSPQSRHSLQFSYRRNYYLCHRQRRRRHVASTAFPIEEEQDDVDDDSSIRLDTRPTEFPVSSSSSSASASLVATVISTSTVTELPKTFEIDMEGMGSRQSPSTTTTNKTVPTAATDDTSIVPSYRTLLIFSMTTVLIWLSEPLLSLVDTTIVGQFASRTTVVGSAGTNTAAAMAVTQLASLGPATTYIDSLFYTTYFLSIATTNIIARNLAIRNYEKLYRTVSHVITVATLLGLFCTVFTLLIGVPFLLPSMVGPSVTSGISATASSSSLLFFARRYVYIRASVAIASIISVTSQSILLATKDTMTPAIAVVATSITNIVGDILLRYYGVQGAAIATALATIVSCTILLHAVQQQYTAWKQQHLKTNNNNNGDLRRIEMTTAPTTTTSSFSLSSIPTMLKEVVRKILLPGKSVISMFSLPDKEATVQLVTLAGP
jgi:Polysaccharide biosynthesis C-terminal domain